MKKLGISVMANEEQQSKHTPWSFFRKELFIISAQFDRITSFLRGLQEC
jgi:hypothetical protein